jgi:pyruvate formate lyase activating enzyme
MATSLQIVQDKERLQNLKQMLHQYSAPAAEALIERKEDGAIQCFACGHRCVVKPGRDGVCRVRFNEDGKLLVPFGYVGALACDPIEKKPFFHVLPGSDALTFGMLGCDYHCGYCFTGDTMVITDRRPMTLEEAFASGGRVVAMEDGDIALPEDLRTIAGSGRFRKIRAVFRHDYRGDLAIIHPYYLPPVRCTPDHRVYATTDPTQAPAPVRARDLTADHYLAIPVEFPDAAGAEPSSLDFARLLGEHLVTHKVRWKLPTEVRQRIVDQTKAGATSQQIAKLIGKSASYVRHVRRKLSREQWDSRTGGAVVEDQAVRFAHERRPGLPVTLPLDEGLANLLGYYCAEGCVVRSKSRPNSHVLNFSFAPKETDLAEEVAQLLADCLGVRPRRVARKTTCAVAVGKGSCALLFKALAGGRASQKRVPRPIFSAPQPVIRAFLDAYVRGDGHCYQNGKISVTTVSRELAYGIAWLVLRTGGVPSVYDYAMPEQGEVQGRRVKRSPRQYSVVWYEQSSTVARQVVRTDRFHLIPLRDVTLTQYDGPVYNMEVEEEHNYLANFLLVSNCQNWVTSQMLRDPQAVAPPRHCTPAQLVDLAIQNGAPVVASSYNEPLITSEWAVAVFKEARARGLKCAYISNGNGTPQVLDYIRPHVEAYKVDLKTFSDKNYRQLGGVLENVTTTIRMLKERGFWVEIVTLVVPGFSDDTDDLKRMAEFLASVDVLMPWHVTAFHPDYKFDRQNGFRNTTVDDLMKVVQIGVDAGLKYIYPGNLPGLVGGWENTKCHHCGAVVIKRRGFLVQQNYVGEKGTCPTCHKPLPGIWGKSGGHGDGRVHRVMF